MNWISIKDKTPPEGDWIIGANYSRVEQGIWLSEEDGFAMPDKSYFKIEITHWMALPDIPKEVKDEMEK